MWVTSNGGGGKTPQSSRTKFLLCCLCCTKLDINLTVQSVFHFIVLWLSVVLYPSPNSPNPSIFRRWGEVRECPFSGCVFKLKGKREIQNAWESSFYCSRWSTDPGVHNSIAKEENGHGEIALLQFPGAAARCQGSTSIARPGSPCVGMAKAGRRNGGKPPWAMGCLGLTVGL